MPYGSELQAAEQLQNGIRELEEEAKRQGKGRIINQERQVWNVCFR